jgi:uncharacterized membrane protein (TIGR02234 family)
VTALRGGVSASTGAAGALPGARREYALALALGAAGAGVVLLSARQGWARVSTPAPAPLPASVISVSGQDLVPLAGALALAALASLAAVIATRRLARRLAGLLMAAFGVVIAVAVCLPLAASDVRAAARVTAVSQAGSATAGGAGGVSPGAVPGGGAAPGVTTVGHVTMTAALWRPAAVAGALMIVAAGLFVAWRGARWPVMSSRYEPPEQAGRKPVADSAAMWDALSGGADPTVLARGSTPPPRGQAPGPHGPEPPAGLKAP